MTDELTLWNDTPTRQAIVDYLAAVTDEGGPDYVPPAERIATFDNDGTLWCEKPAYIQLYFAMDQLRRQAEADPALLAQDAHKAAVEGDLAWFGALYTHNIKALMEIIFATHGGMTQAEFEAQARAFLTEQTHPRFGVPFMELTYKPMVELLRALEAHGFKVFIASAGGMSFVRTVSEDIYAIPRERVIGSNIAFETRSTDDGPVLYRLPGLIEPVNDGPGKPANIELHIGRKPVVAGGNANGDIEMLWYSETSPHRSLQLFLQHDDAEREYDYAGDAAQRGLDLARGRGWTVISMRHDWESVF
jgi:phosphoserine phosphatase